MESDLILYVLGKKVWTGIVPDFWLEGNVDRQNKEIIQSLNKYLHKNITLLKCFRM